MTDQLVRFEPVIERGPGLSLTEAQKHESALGPKNGIESLRREEVAGEMLVMRNIDGHLTYTIPIRTERNDARQTDNVGTFSPGCTSVKLDNIGEKMAALADRLNIPMLEEEPTVSSESKPLPTSSYGSSNSRHDVVRK